MINTTARNYRIEIRRPGASTGFDVTPFCSGDSGGYLTVTVAPADEGGLIRVGGTLNLAVPLGDTRFDTWESSEQWAVGNWIFIEVADALGTLRRPPFSRLYILSTPLPPSPGRESLTLELGDKFQLLDKDSPRRKPNLDGLVAVGVTPGTGIDGSRGEIIDRMLFGTGLTFTGALPNSLRNYEIDYSAPVMGQVGELAIGGKAYLYLDKDDGVHAIPVAYVPNLRLFEHRVGVDDAADFEPLQSPLRAATTVEVISPETAVPESAEDADESNRDPNDPRNSPDWDKTENDNSQKYSGSRTTTSRLSRNTIDEDDESSSSVTAIIRRERWAWSGSTYKLEIEESRSLGLVVPKSLYELEAKIYPSSSVPLTMVNRIDALASVETRTYEGTEEGRLLKVTKITSKNTGEIWGDYYRQIMRPTRQPSPNFTIMRDAEYEETTYTYQTTEGKDSKGQVRSIETKRFKTRGELAGASTQWADPNYISSPGGMRCSELIRQSWRKRSEDEWEFKDEHYQAGRSRTGTVKSFLALRQIKGDTIVARNGDLQPPAADRRPSYDQSRPPRRNQVRGSTTFTSTNTNSDRKRVVVINHVAGRAAARDLAAALGKADQLRQYGFRITTALRDEWFSWAPLSRVDLLWNGYRYLGCSDALTLTLGATQAVVVADFMRAGRAADNSAYPHPPLPPLLPANPDPPPISTEQNQTQLVIPAVQEFGELTARGEMRMVFLSYTPGATTTSFVAQMESRFILNNPLVAKLESRIVMETIPQLRASLDSRIILGAQPEEPFAYWPLDANPWIEVVNGRDLEADVNLGAPRIGSSGGLGYTEFHYEYSDEFTTPQPSRGSLARYNNETWTGDSSGDFSWRLTFEVWFEDVRLTNDLNDRTLDLMALQNLQIRFTTEAIISGQPQFRNRIQITASNSGEMSPLFESAQVAQNIAAQTWLTVDVRLNMTSRTYATFCNGVPGASGALNPNGLPPEYFPGGVYLLNSGDRKGAIRMREIKFYRSNPVPR